MVRRGKKTGSPGFLPAVCVPLQQKNHPDLWTRFPFSCVFFLRSLPHFVRDHPGLQHVILLQESRQVPFEGLTGLASGILCPGARGVAPATKQRSSAVPLDKGTTMPGPARFRLVHLLCPFGGALYADLWRHRPHHDHGKPTRTRTARVGDARRPFSSNTWYAAD